MGHFGAELNEKPMNKKEAKVLRDLQAFIGWAIESKQSYFSVLGTIGHDVSGLFNADDKLFLPRTSGYAERVAGKK